MPSFGIRNGTLSLYSFDLAVVKAIGSRLDDDRKRWFLDTPGIPDEEAVMVIMDQPEQTDRHRRLPQVVVRRDDATIALERMNQGARQYSVPAPTSETVTVNGESGPTARVEKEQSWPVDFTYTIEAHGRSRLIAQRIIHHILGAIGVRGNVVATDSIGCERSYRAFLQGAITDLTELSDVTHRIPAFAVTYRVLGELDLDRTEKTFKTLTADPAVRLSVMG